MSLLTFRYRYEGTPTTILDDFGWLEMRVKTDCRSGRGGFWVQWQEVKEFGESLGTYPIEPDQPLSTEWGYVELGRSEAVLSVNIVPANRLGDLTVRVVIADKDNPEDCTKTSFQTTYAELASFRKEVASLMAGDIEEACLRGR